MEKVGGDWSQNEYQMSALKSELGLSRAQYRACLKRMEKINFEEKVPKWNKLNNLENGAMSAFKIKECNIKIDDLYSHRYTIQGCKEGECKVFVRDVWESVQELLAQVGLDELQFCAKPSYDPVTGHRRFKEIWEGEWYEEEQKQLGEGKPILCLIIASDETHINGKGRTEWPLYVCLGNVGLDERQKMRSKRLIGYIPKIIARGKANGRHADVGNARRILHNR